MFRTLLSLFCAALLASCSSATTKGPVILSASSLQRPLEELADAWASQGKQRPVLSFASSAALARQIDSGTAADIFVSADPGWTDFLIRQGRIDTGKTRRIAGNSLALVANKTRVPTSGVKTILAADLLAGPIAIGDPETVPLGRYTKAALTRIGAWDGIARTAIPASSAQQAVRLVSRGETDIGIIYLSDTVGNQHIRILHRIESTEPIHYIALQLPASAHPDAADFLEFLTSETARAALQKYGFSVP